jgi:hypothetical protein
LPIHLSQITPQEAARKADCTMLALAEARFFALETPEDTAGVLALGGEEAALFLPNSTNAEAAEIARREAAASGATTLMVRTKLEASLPPPFRRGREILTWKRTPEDGPLPDPKEKLEPAPLSVVEENFERWHTVRVPWEKRVSALVRAPQVFGESLRTNIIHQDGRITAYILYAERGDELLVLDVAVDPKAGVVKAGRPIFQAIYLTFQESNVIAPSIPVDDPMNRVFVAMRYHVARRTQEWFIEIDGGELEKSV